MSSFSRDDATPSPPPAPPLPPERYGHRAANALARFAQPFIFSSRPPSTHGDRHVEPGSSRLKANAHGSLSSSSRSISHKTGLPIAALDISPLRTHAVLAGREILKTVQVSDSACVEDFNLRSAIIAYASTHDTSGTAISARHKDQLAATDVKWSHGNYDTTIATAAANGQIVLYDINRPGVEVARLHEHSRQVHRIAFNPYNGALLLSGSQDTTIRLWDLRSLAGDRSVMTCTSRSTFPGNSEGIRDLRWSPTNGVEFAVGTDNGVVQRWDFTKQNAPLLKINAHEKTCHSIDWHPDGKHLASGGADKNVKIWDFSSTDRRMKARWQFRAPRPIFNLRWRIGSPDHHDAGGWRCTQLATSYDNQDPRLHVWDLSRPSIPFREVDQYDLAPSTMLWRSGDLLWSVDNAGMFAQTDIDSTKKVIGKRSVNSVAAAPDGTITFFSERRSPRRISIDDGSSDFVQRSRGRGSGSDKLSSSFSATDGSLEEPSLLSSSFKSRRRFVPSARPSRSLASTPPLAGGEGAAINLDKALQKSELYHLTQMAGCGRIMGVSSVDDFCFLARHYKFPATLFGTTKDCRIHQEIPEIFEHNASVAAYTGQYRLAQSWRIVGLAVQKELEIRADRNRDRRLQELSNASYSRVDSRSRAFANKSPEQDTQSQSKNGSLSAAKTETASAELLPPLPVESGSNMATPMAKPQPDPSPGNGISQYPPMLHEDQSLRLPEPAFGKRSPQKAADAASGLSALRESQNNHTSYIENSTSLSSAADIQTQNSSLEAPGLLDMTSHMREQLAEMQNHYMEPRPLLRLEEPFQLTSYNASHPRFDRHDSNESFEMFSESTASSQRAKSPKGSFGSSQESDKSDPSPGKLSYSYRTDESVEAGTLNSIAAQGASPPPPPLLPLSPVSGDEISAHSRAKIPIEHHPYHEPPVVHINDMSTAGLQEHSLFEDNHESDSAFIESDFVPSRSDPPPTPWTATAMLGPLLDYHLDQLLDTQLPSCLILHLQKFIQLGIPDALVISILLSYHQRLTSQRLYAEAAHIRKLAHAQYPDIAEHGTYGVAVGGPWCTVCRKPSKGDIINFCTRCKQSWAPCPICNGEGPLSDGTGISDGVRIATKDALWVWCQDCGHGGHTGCLRMWWKDGDISEGGCATAGCLHDCVAGTRRTEVLRRMAEKKKKTGTVKSDDWVVKESRAVERTRGLVGKGEGKENVAVSGQSNGKSPAGIGVIGRTGSAGKKVRVIVPQGTERQIQEQSDGKATESKTSASAP
ncbi:MAG: hypothetical protein Q9190_006754 [Brigantiaea leucoxantha]